MLCHCACSCRRVSGTGIFCYLCLLRALRVDLCGNLREQMEFEL